MLMLRSFARGTPGGNVDAAFERGLDLQLQDPATWDLSELDADDEASLQEAGEAGGDGKRRFNFTGGEIKEELTALVRENPDAAASLLRNWIGDAA